MLIQKFAKILIQILYSKKGEAKPTKTKATAVEIKEEEEEIPQIDLEFRNLVKSLKEVTDVKPYIIRLPSLIDGNAKEDSTGQNIPTIFLLPGFDGIKLSFEILKIKIFC